MGAKPRSRRPKDMRASSRMAPFLFAVAVTPFALGAWGCYQGWRTLSWPVTEAKILGSDARRFESERREDGRTVTDVRHTVTIRYSYAVSGREYLGEGIQPYSYGMQNSASAKARCACRSVSKTPTTCWKISSRRWRRLESLKVRAHQPRLAAARAIPAKFSQSVCRVRRTLPSAYL